MLIFCRSILVCQQRYGTIEPFGDVAIEHGNKPALLLTRQESLPGARERLFQGTTIGKRLVKVIDKRWAEVILQ